MRNVMAIVLISMLSAPSGVLAAPHDPSATAAKPPENAPGLRAAGMREASRLAREGASQTTPQRQPAKHGSWVGRHPALFGAAIGAGVGAAVGLSNTNEMFCSGGDEDCLFYGASGVAFGAAVGAGVGLLVGHVVGKLTSHGQ